MALGQRIRALRKAHQITARAFAQYLGINYGFYGEVERDTTAHVSVKYLIPIADALGTSIDYLVGRTDDPTFRPKQAREQALV